MPVDLVVLRGKCEPCLSSAFQNAETLVDPDALLERLRVRPSGIRGVAIAPDFEGLGHVVQQIRAADPTVGVTILAADGESAVFPETGGHTFDTSVFGRAERAPRAGQARATQTEKLASIVALTAGIAHDVGTPMAAILGYAELIAKSVGDEKNRERASIIVDQVHRLRDLIGTLVNLSRTGDRHRVPLELRGVLDKALDFYREKFKRHGVEVECRYGSAPQILGDPDWLHHVLLSLYLDALEAMNEGGVLRVSLAETDAGEAEICIAHSGTGAVPDPAFHLTDVDSSEEDAAGGTDLGLFVAKAIIEEHGGKFKLTRESDRGSEFRLSFPAFTVS